LYAGRGTSQLVGKVWQQFNPHILIAFSLGIVYWMTSIMAETLPEGIATAFGNLM